MLIGQKIIHLSTVDSTNNYVANLVKQDEIVHGTVIMADEQFAGKGQRGAKWLVKPGENLTFSFFLDNVNLSVTHQFYLTQLVSVSLIHFLQKIGVQAKIKWPNDVYVDTLKIAGILIENQVKNGIVHSSIVGIGLNVNQCEFGELNATSLSMVSGKTFNHRELLFSFIHCFNTLWEQYPESARANLHEIYLNHLLRYRQTATYIDQSGEFIGEITGVRSSGKLEVKKASESVQYDLKEIQFKL